MDAVKYLNTLSRMKAEDAFSVEEFIDFIGKTPEHKVEFVERWGNENPVKEETSDIGRIREDITDLYNLIEKINWNILNIQLRIDDCEEDIEDLRAEVHSDDE